MKKSIIAAVLSVMVLGAGISANAATLWTSFGDGSNNKAMGVYWPLGNSGMSLGTFAGFVFPSDPSSSTEDFGINSGFVSVDGIPVLGGVELGLGVTKAQVKDSGYGLSLVLGKSFMFDLTDDVQVGFYMDLLNYSWSSVSNSASSFTLGGNLYPVLSAEVKLW